MVIAGQDETYINRLAKWFRENKPNQFQITAFTEKESLYRFIGVTDLTIDVLLIDEEFIDLDQYTDMNIIILGQALNPAFNELKQVDKYLPAPSLCSEILTQITDSEQPKWIRTGKSDLIACLSPDPRLKSTLALYLCKLNSDSIYVNFESFPFYLSSLCSYRNQKNLSDVLYNIKASKKNITMVLESAVCNSEDGMSYIPPMDNPKDLWQLSEKETGVLIESLMSWGHFTNIIADIELSACSHTLQWLKSASLILIPFTISQLNQVRRLKNLMLDNIPSQKVKLILTGEQGVEDLPDDFNDLYLLQELKPIQGSWVNCEIDATFSQNLSSLLAKHD